MVLIAYGSEMYSVVPEGCCCMWVRGILLRADEEAVVSVGAREDAGVVWVLRIAYA